AKRRGAQDAAAAGSGGGVRDHGKLLSCRRQDRLCPNLYDDKSRLDFLTRLSTSVKGWPMAQAARTAKPYHHGELREALVHAVRKLLEERGVRGFTLRECARRASVSHAAPAHHFASIDDLLAEIATRGYHELTQAMVAEAKRISGDAAARLGAQGVGYIAFAACHPVPFHLL